VSTNNSLCCLLVPPCCLSVCVVHSTHVFRGERVADLAERYQGEGGHTAAY